MDFKHNFKKCDILTRQTHPPSMKHPCLYHVDNISITLPHVYW